MGDIVVSFDEVKNLREELNSLNQEYLKLYEKVEDLKKEKEYLESVYLKVLGALIFLRFESEIKFRRVKKKLTLIIIGKNKGEKVKVQELDKALEEELKEFYSTLEGMRNNLKKAKEFFELPTLSKEEVKRVKLIFRNLAKVLHPDVNGALEGKKMELWLQVKEAYENNDLNMLIILEGIVSEEELKDNIKIDSMEESIGAIKKKIKDITRFITTEEEKFPLNIKELINDEQYIKEKKENLNEDLHYFREQILFFENTIREVLRELDYE